MSALGWSMAIWLGCLMLAPVSPRWPNDLTGPILAVTGLMALAMGFLLPALLGTRLRPMAITRDGFRLVFWGCLALAALGVAAKAADIFVIRGVAITDDVLGARNQAAAAGSSVVSIAAALLLPFGIGSLLLAVVGRRTGHLSSFGVMPLLLASAGPAMAVLFGSRSQILLLGLCALAAFLLLRERIRMRHILIAAALSVLGALLFSVMFIWRFEQMGISPLYMVRYSAYTITVPLSDWYLELMDFGGVAAPLAAFASLFQYLLHGVFEFFWLVELKDGDFAGGGYQFFFFEKMINFLVGGSQVDATRALDMANPRAGVFQTFFGPAYIDFGPYMLVFCFAFGACLDLVRRSVLAGNLFAFPLYILMLAQLLLVPVVNGLMLSASVIANFVLLCLALGGPMISGARTAS
jgi:hypothetical protein